MKNHHSRLLLLSTKLAKLLDKILGERANAANKEALLYSNESKSRKGQAAKVLCNRLQSLRLTKRVIIFNDHLKTGRVHALPLTIDEYRLIFQVTLEARDGSGQLWLACKEKKGENAAYKKHMAIASLCLVLENPVLLLSYA